MDLTWHAKLLTDWCQHVNDCNVKLQDTNNTFIVMKDMIQTKHRKPLKSFLQVFNIHRGLLSLKSCWKQKSWFVMYDVTPLDELNLSRFICWKLKKLRCIWLIFSPVQYASKMYQYRGRDGIIRIRKTSRQDALKTNDKITETMILILDTYNWLKKLAITIVTIFPSICA